MIEGRMKKISHTLVQQFTSWHLCGQLPPSGSGSSTSVCVRAVLGLRKLFTVRINAMPLSFTGSSRVIPCFSGYLECFPVQNPIICASCHQAYMFPAFSNFLLRQPSAPCKTPQTFASKSRKFKSSFTVHHVFASTISSKSEPCHNFIKGYMRQTEQVDIAVMLQTRIRDVFGSNLS